MRRLRPVKQTQGKGRFPHLPRTSNKNHLFLQIGQQYRSERTLHAIAIVYVFFSSQLENMHA